MTLSVAVFIWVQPRPSRLSNFGWVMRCATSSSPWGCVGGCSWGPRGQLWCCCRGCGQSPHVGGNRLWPLVWLILHTRQSVASSPRLSMVVGCIVIGPCFYDIFPSSFYYWVRMSSYLRQIPFLTFLLRFHACDSDLHPFLVSLREGTSFVLFARLERAPKSSVIPEE
jgi:hypothetical protein